MTSSPALAIVIPTHDRRGSVERTLRALSAQSYSMHDVEVIVVADGCTDGTPAIAGGGWPFRIRVIEQTGQGPAAARNRGAAATAAELLIFIDDDIEAWPEFVRAHEQVHADGNPARVAIGYLPPQLQGRRDLFAIMLRAWWEGMFDRMRDPGHRFAYTDLLSGNFSIRRSLFWQVGGFDETLRCHEDYELGLRLIGAGAQLTFAECAAGWHHEHTDLIRALGRKREEGQADVELARRHPGIAPSLPLCRGAGPSTLRGRVLRKLAVVGPEAGDRLETMCRQVLAWLEAARLRSRWRRLLDELLWYWYWRGVGESAGINAVAALCPSESGPVVGAYEIDLRKGLAAAAQELEDVRPMALRLRWGTLEIGTVPPQPGAEPLRGRHLPSLLQRRYRLRFAEVLARAAQTEREPASTAHPLRSLDIAADGSGRGI